MKKLLQVAAFFIFLFLLSQSCKKGDENSSEINMQALYKCNDSQNFDSSNLAAKLIGTWKLKKISCFWSGATSNPDKNVIVTFTNTGTFTVSENSIINTQGNWRLKIVDSGIHGLDLDTPSIYLYGRILLCENQVVFNDSYIDGCDNLFERK